jgi:acyl-CoA reductase-like NAD-dependent aldehyde dehydrogenase
MNSGKTVRNATPTRNWINGEWISSSTVANSVNPSSGEVLGQYSAGGRAEATAAIAAARKAFDEGTWAHDPQLRCGALIELAGRLSERAEAIGLMLSREMGRGRVKLLAPFLPARDRAAWAALRLRTAVADSILAIPDRGDDGARAVGATDDDER